MLPRPAECRNFALPCLAANNGGSGTQHRAGISDKIVRNRLPAYLIRTGPNRPSPVLPAKSFTIPARDQTRHAGRNEGEPLPPSRCREPAAQTGFRGRQYRLGVRVSGRPLFLILRVFCGLGGGGWSLLSSQASWALTAAAKEESMTGSGS